MTPYLNVINDLDVLRKTNLPRWVGRGLLLCTSLVLLLGAYAASSHHEIW